jgi:hypothetical protein
VAEGDGLLNRCTALKPYRGFESLRLRFCDARAYAGAMPKICPNGIKFGSAHDRLRVSDVPAHAKAGAVECPQKHPASTTATPKAARP